MNFFTRIDPAKNVARFWRSLVTPTLLGGWSLLREWGRIGSPGDGEQPQLRARGGSTASGTCGHPPPRASRLRADAGCGRALVGGHGGGWKHSRAAAAGEKQIENAEGDQGRTGRFRFLKSPQFPLPAAINQSTSRAWRESI
jgi:WGR domain